MFIRLIGLFCLASIAAAPAQASSAHAPVPFEAMFSKAETHLTPAVMSPDGAYFAVEVVRTPPDHDVGVASNKADWIAENGKPIHAVGASLHVGRLDGASFKPVLQDADSWRPSWSPDGSKLAFYSDAAGAVHLWVYDVQTDKSRRIGDALIKGRALSWLGAHARWAADGKSVYVTLKPEGQTLPRLSEAAAQQKKHGADGASVFVFRADTDAAGNAADDNSNTMEAHFRWTNNADLVEVEIATGAVRKIVRHDAAPPPSVMRLSPSGRWLSYLSVFYFSGDTDEGYSPVFDLAVVPADSSEKRAPTVLSEGIDAPAPYYTNAYRWGPSDDRIAFFRDDQLWMQDFRGRRPGKVKRLDGDLGPLVQSVILFTRKGDAVLAAELDEDAPGGNVGMKGNGRIRAFHLLPVDGGAPKPVPFDFDRWNYVEFLTVNDELLWQPTDDALTVHARDRKTEENVLLRIDLRRGKERELLRWSGHVSNLAGDESHQNVIALLESLDTPPDLYGFNADFTNKTRLTNLNPQLSDAPLGQSVIIPVTVPTHDGTLQEVNVGVILPPGAKKGDRVPAVVTFYPGKDLTALGLKNFMGGEVGLPWGLLTSRGYAVVFAHVLAGPGGTKGTILKDLTDSLLPQVYAMAHSGYVDINRLALTGVSFGGYSTAGIASRTNLFRAVIPQNGPYDISGGGYGAFIGLSSSETFWQRWLERSQPRIGDHPWADLRRVIDASPYYQADKILTPMLILQGEDDYFLQDAQKMYTALSRLGRTVELAVYEGSGHGLPAWPDANAIDGARRVLRFLDEHLGPGFDANDDTLKRSSDY